MARESLSVLIKLIVASLSEHPGTRKPPRYKSSNSGTAKVTKVREIARRARNIARATNLLKICALVLGIVLSIPAAARTMTINGVYDLPAIGERIPETVLTNPNIDGIAIRVGWSGVEPSDGVFNWSGVDALIAQVTPYSKKVSINIAAGWKAPAWVYSEGAQGFNFVWDKSWGPGYCGIVTIPVPWDPVFMAKWEDLVAAFGVKYGSNRAVTHVKLTGINSETGDTLLPSNAATSPINGGQCKSYNDTRDWRAIGYTRIRVENAWAEIADAFNAAFPEREFAGMFAFGGFPPIDNIGNPIPRNTVDHTVSLNLISQGVQLYGAGRFAAQSDGLSATYIYAGVSNAAASIDTGYQMVGVMGSGLLAAVVNAANAGAKFLEIYETDLTNPQLQATIAYAHSRLLSN